MAYRYEETNNDGLSVTSGPLVSGNLRAGTNDIDGKIKEIQMSVDVAAGLHSAGTAFSEKDFFIPAGAMIVTAYYDADVDFDNAVEFGTAQLDGTAINATGLIATTTSSAIGSGALVGTSVAYDSYLTAASVSTAATTGKGTLVVQYVQ